MWLLKTFLPALTILLIDMCSSSSGSIQTQTRRAITVDVDDVMMRDYTEISAGSEMLCASATNTEDLYCYSAPRCVTVLSSYGDIRGPMTPGWTCKSGELAVWSWGYQQKRIKRFQAFRGTNLGHRLAN